MKDYQQEFDKFLPDFLEPKPKARNCTNCKHYDHARHHKDIWYCKDCQEYLPLHPLDHTCDAYEDLTCGGGCKFYDEENEICNHDGQKRNPGIICPFDIHGLLSM